MLKLAEECSEYAAAVVKYLIGEGSREDVLEELADVRTVMEENEIVMDPAELARVHKIMRAKIDRQVERIQARR
jgi:NTP pyrophosphatase (non-canonical NTP hydrolase)